MINYSLQSNCLHLFQEAAGLSSLKPLLDKKQMNLIGVVHENHSLDVFQQFLKGPIYLDPEVRLLVVCMWHSF